MASQLAMSTTCYILDTSYLWELFRVPGHSDKKAVKEVRRRIQEAVEKKAILIVPLPCVFELGDHIAHVRSGNVRHTLAKDFLATIEKCIKNSNPWTITPSVGIEVLPELCRQFAGKYE